MVVDSMIWWLLRFKCWGCSVLWNVVVWKRIIYYFCFLDYCFGFFFLLKWIIICLFVFFLMFFLLIFLEDCCLWRVELLELLVICLLVLEMVLGFLIFFLCKIFFCWLLKMGGLVNLVFIGFSILRRGFFVFVC